MFRLIDWIQRLSVWSVVLPVLIGGARLRSLSGISLVVWWLSVVAVFPQLIRFVSPDKQLQNTVYNLYTVVEFTLMLFLLKICWAQRLVN